jgi:hypothetical protein
MIEELRLNGLAGGVLSTFRSAWKSRSDTLSQQRYDVYGDLLYAYLVNLLTCRKQQIFDALLVKIQTAVTPRDIEVPIWEYIACYRKDTTERIHETRIGTAALGGRAVPQVPIYTVLQNTDVLPHLASVFGADFYVYDRYKETVVDSETLTQSRHELVLAYYPHGLPQTLSDRVVASYTRHLSRTPYTPSWTESLTLTDPFQTPPRILRREVEEVD